MEGKRALEKGMRQGNLEAHFDSTKRTVLAKLSCDSDCGGGLDP